jgi:hypothetical protein
MEHMIILHSIKQKVSRTFKHHKIQKKDMNEQILHVFLQL